MSTNPQEMDIANVRRYKELAETRYARKRYTQEHLGVLFVKANEYVEEQAKKGKPLTIGGFQRAFHIDHKTWGRIRDGEMDHALYEFLEREGLPLDYADGLEAKIWEKDGVQIPLITYSEFIAGIYSRQQELLEEACILKGNPVGSIFLLKSLHSFNDQSGVQITNQTLNVFDSKKLGTKEEIETARKLLG